MKNQIFIDLNNLNNNYKKIADFVGGIDKCAPVLKGNCYGLGQEVIAYSLLKTGIKKAFCFTFDEGVQIRKVANKFFPKKDFTIYVLNGIYSGEEKFFKEYKLIPVLDSDEQIEIWSNFAKKNNQKLNAILQFDTGMNRSGFNYSEAQRIFEKIKKENQIKIDYVLSHFACADELDSPRNTIQWERFKKVRKIFSGFPCCFANSDGTVLDKKYHYDLVRIGKGLYGPISWKRNKLDLEQVLSFVSYIKDISENRAIIPVGYKNGYFSNLVDKNDYIKSSFVFCNGKKLYISDIRQNEIEVLIDKSDSVKIGDKVEIASENVLLDRIGENSNNIFYVLQISFIALNRGIVEYKGLPKDFNGVSKMDNEILDLVSRHQKKIELDENGNLQYFKSYIIEKRLIKEKDTVGYGANYTVRAGDWLATMPVGYSDGVMRILNATGFYVKCNGIDCEVVGNISMNQTIIKIPEGFEDKINLDDEVLIFNYQNTKDLEKKLNVKLEEFTQSVIYKNSDF